MTIRPATVWRSVTGSGAVIIGSGSAAAQLLALLVSPLLTRIFDPADFGLLALFTTICSVVVILATLRLELAVPTAESDQSARVTAWFVRCLAVAVTLLATGLGLLLMRLDTIPGLPSALLPFLWLVGPTVGLMALYELDAARLVRAERHRRLSARAFMQGAGQVVVQVVGGVLGWGVSALIVGFGVGRAVAQTIRVPAPWGTFPSRAQFRVMLSRNRQYPTYLAPAAMLNMLALGVPVLVLSAVYSDAVTGQYALTLRAIGTPVALVTLAVGQVYFGALARMMRESADDPRAYFRSWAGKLLVLCGLPLLIGSVAAIWVFPIIFGSEWQQAGVFAAILGPATALQVVASPLSPTLIVTGRLSLQLRWDALRVALLVLAGVAASVWSWAPTVLVAVFGGVLIATYGLLLLLCWRSLPPSAGSDSTAAAGGAQTS